ncbi:MAG: hypothetical protein V3U20_04935 [Thermoplasmata archaeon]
MQSSPWNMELSQRRYNRSWWWWFWIFFIENKEYPPHPKQLAVIWSTKDCDRFKINDILWIKEKGVRKIGNRIEFNGVIGAWFYDGKRMIEPVILDKRDFIIENRGGNGLFISRDNDDYVLSGNPNRYNVRLKKKGFEVDFELTKTDDILSEDDHTRNNFTKSYGYEILKIRRTNLRGRIRAGLEDSEVKGTGYFQKVMINAPLILPWYWGTVHMNDGSYLQYYMLHLGPPMFRRKISQNSFLDFGERYISKSINFYSKDENRFYKFKDVKISKQFNKAGLPVFMLKGKDRWHEISITLNSYSRACWYFEQPMLRFIKTLMYYNEYPVTMSRFSLKGRGKRITEKELGGGVGNSEHAWGCLR